MLEQTNNKNKEKELFKKAAYIYCVVAVMNMLSALFANSTYEMGIIIGIGLIQIGFAYLIARGNLTLLNILTILLGIGAMIFVLSFWSKVITGGWSSGSYSFIGGIIVGSIVVYLHKISKEITKLRPPRDFLGRIK